ncbi:hypothetical protein JYU34_000843 [Plutella xylostella]|uniref:Uncharacterized protein n=1 Tax=Plutella xylostella TaxID=51655 RepID=A0ABQ7R8N4_PLUXY|nr:hypothetical protein JYU34_000843 [Plutella xylostella]
MSDFEYDDAAARKSHARSSRKAFESEDDYFESNPKRIAKPTKRASQLAESDAESTVARNKKKAPSKSAAGKRHCDSDDESVPRRKSKEVKPKETKRKAPPPSKSKRPNWRVFDSDSEEESALLPGRRSSCGRATPSGSLTESYAALPSLREGCS